MSLSKRVQVMDPDHLALRCLQCWSPTSTQPLSSKEVRASLPKPPTLSAISLEDERAVLPIEGEVGDRDGAGGTKDGRRQPVDTTIRGHEHVAVEGHLEDTVHAVCIGQCTELGQRSHSPRPALCFAWMGPGGTSAPS